MWTAKNRARYDRSRLRYPSDLTDAAIVPQSEVNRTRRGHREKDAHDP
jgi:hypothetical protein